MTKDWKEKIILGFLRASMNVIAIMHSDRYGMDIDPEEEEERRAKRNKKS
jgi:hypothetical protein